MTNYRTQRAIVSILLMLVIGFFFLLFLGILGLIVFALFNPGGATAGLLPSTFISLGAVIVYGGVTYVLLHAILAVFDIADNTRKNRPESASQPQPVLRRPKTIDHNERTPVENPEIIDPSRVPPRR